MCGIAGVIGLDRHVASARVREALRRLVHRGPDGEGWFEDDDVVLGMRRLAIIDVAGGDQPIWNEDRSVAVICNGEIYDYVERLADLAARHHRFQSRSDVNVIPHLYEEHGRDAFAHIRGMFAAAIWDGRSRRLILARDRAGKKPLYYAPLRDGLAFASELPALLALVDRPPDLNPEALADYLRLGFVPHPETIYTGVSALPPGGTLVAGAGVAPTVTPYWRPPEPSPYRGTQREALTELDARLREAVALRLRSDVPVGMFLSGGIDSGLVAAHAAAAGARDLLCFVVEVDDPRFNEAAAARATAARLGLPVETIQLRLAPVDAVERISRLYGQPFGDASAVPTYHVAKAASGLRKVILNGDGGDEVFAGYRRYWAGRYGARLRLLPRPVRRGLANLADRVARQRGRRSAAGFAARMLRGLGADDGSRYLIWTVDLFADADLSRYFPDLPATGSITRRLGHLSGEAPSCGDLRAFLRSDFRLILPDDLLTKMDMATMANSVEARSPLLDIPLTEFAWSLPERWLLHATQTKPLLRALARRHLPAAIAAAPKRGFEVPLERWIAHDLHDAVGDLLLSPDSRVAALGQSARITALVTGRDAFAGNRANTIWCLLMLELFLRAPVPQPVSD